MERIYHKLALNPIPSIIIIPLIKKLLSSFARHGMSYPYAFCWNYSLLSDMAGIGTKLQRRPPKR